MTKCSTQSIRAADTKFNVIFTYSVPYDKKMTLKKIDK